LPSWLEPDLDSGAQKSAIAAFAVRSIAFVIFAFVVFARGASD
jgi:hypothetical protein